MTFTLNGTNSSEQMYINRKVGRLGEKIAKDDYRKHVKELKKRIIEIEQKSEPKLS